jgi:hypothetical protein
MPCLPLHTKDNRCKIIALITRINAQKLESDCFLKSGAAARLPRTARSSILRYACITLCELAIPRFVGANRTWWRSDDNIITIAIIAPIIRIRSCDDCKMDFRLTRIGFLRARLPHRANARYATSKYAKPGPRRMDTEKLLRCERRELSL